MSKIRPEDVDKGGQAELLPASTAGNQPGGSTNGNPALETAADGGETNESGEQSPVGVDATVIAS